ncbi:PREDICTED: uncharacterized protein LOC104814547 isoform X2 [Tarenaya hassleriana]|uniref:uncharacterized protein LOC104814547 isoform X2 n=1 Tax=Tarenaya hassleriana TaxID=28532 RepID=UPI00053C9F79|nr:PREDICTED: uncharacterized protein LOC104814547 isoform X2 [Tarenaya hassleriana]
MNGLNSREIQKMENPVPGCLGRMVNLFDLGTAGSGNKLLTDKPHRYASSLSRSQSDVAQMPSPPSGDHTEDELIMSNLRRSASNGTPMKKLIAQEMSKEEHKQSPTNVVAKLMGLDTFPQLQLDNTISQSSKSSSYSRYSPSNSGSSLESSRELKDVCEMWQLPQNANRSRDDEIMTEKQRDIVRKKFMEGKRLVTDEKLHQSKEFQDAVEVLSSNKDLFVKFLQESNSFFSQHLSDFQPLPPHPETKRITVLRPSKAIDTEKSVVQDQRNKQIKKSVHGTGWDNCYPGRSSSFLNQPAKEYGAQPTRIVVLKPSPGKDLDIKALASSPSSHCFDEPGGDAESKVAAREITQKMRENLMGHQRSETLFSSILSNGYIGDNSSFEKSDSEEYPMGNLENFEIMSPVSRHSWDSLNRIGGSPFSSSSLSRASFSPESSVCREAKKRLSERWALMALNGSTQQQKYIPRTSSTLGEMLSLSDTKGPTEENNEARASTSCISSNLSPEASSNGPLKTFARSKSTPGVKAEAAMESRNETSPIMPLPGRTCENCPSHDALGRRNLFPSEFCMQDEPSSSKLPMAGNAGENLDQPSPISVLQPSFEEESIGIPESYLLSMLRSQGLEMSLKPNLIDKSPPIGSIARTLLWDGDLSTDKNRPETVIQEDDEDWYFFVETLLTDAGLGRSVSSDPFLVRWHSPESPLDPSLRDKYTDQDNNKDPIHESKRRQKRSNRKLIFDRVNAIIAETTTATTMTCARTNLTLDMVDLAWSQLKGWLCGSEGETVEPNSVAAERVVRDDVVGRTWLDGLRLEMDDLGLEIEGKLLKELVEETVIDLITR